MDFTFVAKGISHLLLQFDGGVHEKLLLHLRRLKTNVYIQLLHEIHQYVVQNLDWIAARQGFSSRAQSP